MSHKASELTVITKAKDLCSYILVVTQKSPKQYRYTFVSKLQNTALKVIEDLLRANDVYLTKEDLNSQRFRLELQRSAMTDLKILDYISMLSAEQKVLTMRQYEQISKHIVDCQNLLGAWINSDKKRLKS